MGMLVAEKSAVVATVNAAGKRSRTRIREGKLYRSDDPVVQGREHLFRPVEQVEQATASPGEKRSLSRPRKRAATQTAAPRQQSRTQPKSEEAPAASAEDSESE